MDFPFRKPASEFEGQWVPINPVRPVPRKMDANHVVGYGRDLNGGGQSAASSGSSSAGQLQGYGGSGGLLPMSEEWGGMSIMKFLEAAASQKMALMRAAQAQAQAQSQHGYSPMPFIPNLNSLPDNNNPERLIYSESTSSPVTHATLERNKRVLDCPPPEIIDLVDDNEDIYGNFGRNGFNTLQQSVPEKPAELCYSNPAMSSQIVASQQQEGEMNAVVSSSGDVPVQQMEIENHAEGENGDIDLNKTPQQKTRRKKHRPKVVREGKPKRTPKKPVTPKSTQETETPPPGKRKYVRKNKDQSSPEATPSSALGETVKSKRKYVRKKNVQTSPEEIPSSALGEIVDPESVNRTKPVRRTLKFNSEGSCPVREECPSSAAMVFTNNAQSQQVHAASAAAASSRTISPVRSAHACSFMVLNNTVGGRITVDLNGPMDQFGNDCVRIQENPNLQPQLSGQDERMKLKQDYKRKDQEDLRELARKNNCLNISASHQISLKAGENQIDPNNLSDLRMQGTKRDHSFVDDIQLQGNIRNLQFINRAGQSSNSLSNVPNPPEIHKKKRTMNRQSGLTSSASPTFTYTPSTGWQPIQQVQNASEMFTFADAQMFMNLKKLQSSESMPRFSQDVGKINNISVQALNPTSLSPVVNRSDESTAVKSPRHNNIGCSQTPAPEKPSECSNNRGTQVQVEALAVDNEVKPKARRRKKKEKVVNFMSTNPNQIGHEAAHCQNGYSAVQKSVRVSASASQKSNRSTSHLRISSVQDHQSSSNHKGSVCTSFQYGAVVPYGDPLDDIIQKLKHLNINGGCGDITVHPQNALVPYAGGGGAMVPFEGPFDLIKRRKPRPKVDLDPESNRVWKLLMGKECGEGEAGEDKEKWWEEERRVFRGRADSFIARMHLVQGDRRFSQWKGSVVDSVIGVFLTQNVSDHLSSSAFMCLAARFPLRPRGNCETHNAEVISRPISLDNASRWQGRMSEQELCDQSSLVIHDTEKTDEKEMTNSNESLESNIGGGMADFSKDGSLDFHERELGVGHGSPDSDSGTAVTVTSSTSVAEGEDRKSLEDVVSSYHSVVSSQNSSEFLFQVADQSKVSSLLNFEADEFLNVANVGTGSFTELLKMASSRELEMKNPCNGRISSIAHCGGIDQLACLGMDNIQSVPNGLNYSNGAVSSLYTSSSPVLSTQHDCTGFSCAPSPSYYYQSSSKSRMLRTENTNVVREGSQFQLPPVTFVINKTTEMGVIGRQNVPSAEMATSVMDQHMSLASKIVPPANSYTSVSKTALQTVTSPGIGFQFEKHSCCQGGLPNVTTSNKNITGRFSNTQDGNTGITYQRETEVGFQAESTQHSVEAQDQIPNPKTSQTCSNSHNQRNSLEAVEAVESNVRNDVCTSPKVSTEIMKGASKSKRVKAEAEKKKTFDWDILRKNACHNTAKKERSSDSMDSLDYEAVRCADVNEISHTIRERGMNNMLAERMKDFLNRVVRDHGSIDLEWLRNVPPDKAKDYLLSIRGLGLKSVECVRLLTLHHLAFPVDTNVGRICVRLGWVPLQPLPESLQLHLLEMYPILETIQKYLWPRLCNLDQRTLYELHYQMITFGKVFCTKSKPNCNACPMRGECKHFASAFASARLALPGPEEKSLVNSTFPTAPEMGHAPIFEPLPLPQLEGSAFSQDRTSPRTCEPIIEEPATPEPECIETSESAIEDAFYYDPDEIPTIKLNLEEFTLNLQNYMQENNIELQDGDMSKALVAITPEAASIPMPKLKNVSRLRTEHQVYELPDSHTLLEGLDRREPDDPCPYLLAIWTPGETAQSTEPPKQCCNSQDIGNLCDKSTCFSCNSVREAQTQMVRGTLLIPCRTAMRGSFPLNGTYFQVNEVFADHDSSRNPIDVPRDFLWSLPRRTVYFGTSIPSIFKGLTTEGIQHCFWRGFVCVRGFDRTTRAPRPLYARLHFPASKSIRNKRAAAAAAAKENE